MFYVYVYKDPRPTKAKQVVYVGKGTGDRMYAHWKKRVHKNKAFGAFLALLRRTKLEPIIELVADYSDEAEAFAEEMHLIALYGRRDLRTGTLFNLTDGGEGFAGVVRTDVWRANISAALRDQDVSERNSAAARERWSSPEYREKTVAAIREAIKDPEVIARREAGKAAFIHTDEFRQTMHAATSKMWQDPDYREKVTSGQLASQGSPEQRQKKSVNSKALWADRGAKIAEGIKRGRSTEASKAKTSAQARTQWADPEYAAMQTANNREIANREDVKAAKSAATKAMWADPEWRAKMMEARAKKKTKPS